MAAEIPTVEPTEVVAGNTIKWLIPEDDDYPIADSWVLSYAFVNKNHTFEVTCSDNGDQQHLASIDAATSAAIPAGNYKWQSYITKATERYPVDTGSLTIKENFAALDGGFDTRSHWQTVLDNVEAVIQGRATRDQSSYTVNGRQLSRTPMADLIKLYNKAKTQVAGEMREEALRKGMGHSGVIKVRM